MQYPSKGQPLGPQTPSQIAEEKRPLDRLSPLGALADQWLEAIEKKDRYTAGHIKRTAHYALKIARALDGMDERLLERVRLAAMLHDLGKIEIEDAILKKGAALEPLEWGSMREHPRLGFEMFEGESIEAFDPMVADGIRFHHERWDGQGYPLKLAGPAIPWIARLIAVADAYDAMVSTRPYRKGMAPALAYEELQRQSGIQFDPGIVTAFLRAFAPTGGNG
jgi:HD-GYP domain-containing protein (c-di-GMP phosphodiesterase class II)